MFDDIHNKFMMLQEGRREERFPFGGLKNAFAGDKNTLIKTKLHLDAAIPMHRAYSMSQ